MTRVGCQIWDDFSSNTTAHGLGRIHSSQPVWRTVVWTIAFLVCAAACLFLIISNFAEFYEMNTSIQETTSFDQTDLGSVEISFCPSFVKARSSRKLAANTTNSTAAFQHLSCSDGIWNYFADYNMSDAERQAIWKSHNPMTSSTIFEASEGSPEGSREFYFDIHLEDMLVECQYGPGMLSCGLEDFTEWWHPTFGRCYTFNKTEMDDLGYEGLELIMYLPSTDPLLSSEDRKMAEWWNLKAGKKGTALLFTIQDPGTKPNMQKAIPVSPGFNSYVDIAVDIHHRLKAPYRSDCTTQAQLDVYDKYKYSLSGCYEVCYARSMVEQCGCHWTGYADLIKAPETQYCFEKLCEFKTAEIMQCLIKLFLGMDQGICSNCRLPCFEREFTANLRQTVWMEDDIQGFLSSVKNTTGFYKDLSFSLPASDGKGFNVTDAAQRGVVQKTISVVRIHRHPTQPVAIKKEVAAVSPAALFSNLGGSLGMFIGFSFLTVFELLELLITYIHSVWKNSKTHPSGPAVNPDKQ